MNVEIWTVWPRNSFFWDICFEFWVLVLCSAAAITSVEDAITVIPLIGVSFVLIFTYSIIYAIFRAYIHALHQIPFTQDFSADSIFQDRECFRIIFVWFCHKTSFNLQIYWECTVNK